MSNSILAIDPGPAKSAWIEFAHDQPWQFGIHDNETMLDEIIPMYRESQLAIEMVGHYGKGMPAGKEVFDTCVWIGRFIQHWKRSTDRKHIILLRKTVCAHVCGSAKAKDGNIRQSMLDRFGPQWTKKAQRTFGARWPWQSRRRTP